MTFSMCNQTKFWQRIIAAGFHLFLLYNKKKKKNSVRAKKILCRRSYTRFSCAARRTPQRYLAYWWYARMGNRGKN